MLEENVQKSTEEPVNRTSNDTELYDEASEEAVLLSSSPVTEEYDYDSLKMEYYNEISQENTTTFNFSARTEAKEPVNQAINKIVDFKKPKNCSKEESSNFGIKSLECLWDDYTHKKGGKMKILKKALKILVIWMMIYIVITGLCWCKHGKLYVEKAPQ